MLKKLFSGRNYIKEKKEEKEKEVPIDKEHIYKKLFEIAPNFVCKLEHNSTHWLYTNGIRFMFANEKGGTGDYEEKYGKNKSNESNAEIFCQMARQFENLTIEPYYDNPEKQGEYLALKETKQYHSQLDYRWLSASDLFCYFTWRTALRKVLYENIESLPEDNKEIQYLSKVSNDIYLQLYLLEIINQIGIENPEEGYQIIHERLRQVFGNIDQVSSYKDIEKNYALYYGLNDGTEYSDKIDNVITALKKREITKFIDNCQESSTYDYLQSSFYSTEHGYLLFEVLPYVMSGIKKYMEEKNIDFENLLVGKFIHREWEPFSGYNYLERNIAQPVCQFNPEYEQSYSYTSGKWLEHYWWHHTTYTSAIIGYIIKMTEKILREMYKYNSRITVNMDRLRKNPDFRGDTEEDTLYKAFRELVYGSECQDCIRKIVKTYIENKVRK